jgi:hypothetical protein
VLRLGTMLALCAATAATFAVTAGAGQVFRETVHEEGVDVVSNFCDVPGMTVSVAFTLDLRIHVVPHGRDRLDYFLQHGQRSEVLTNLANGKRITSFANVIEKDKTVTDNGDGTLTIVILATGNATLYGADGKAIARNPGQVRFAILVDHGGTPTDPTDDEFLEDLGPLKGSTGRSDDFCTAAVEALS